MRNSNVAWVGDYPPWPTPSTAPSVPWDNTEINPYGSSSTSTITWPPPLDPHPAELESFEEFVIWACGFTDPEHPPSQRKWEEFQKRVQQLAADFVEYKRARRERERLNPLFTVSSNASGL